jgi:hypothetical protein
MQGSNHTQKISSFNKSGEKHRARLLDRPKRLNRRNERAFKERTREAMYA